MKKVAIVGVEGSGKTVMLAGLGELYTHPDKRGFFLGPKNFGTASYVTEKIARMRAGEWPGATADDAMQGLDWTLRRRIDGQNQPADVCEVSFLDFPGEVYRMAFGINTLEEGMAEPKIVESLKKYIREADDLVVLINLRDVITQGMGEPRVQEAMWITNEILSFALKPTSERLFTPRASIVLSQADSYVDTISSCGGPKGVLQKYLPHVANNYGWLDVFNVSAVDKTKLDDCGNVIPAPDFQPTGLKPLMEWIIAGRLTDAASKKTGCGCLLAKVLLLFVLAAVGSWFFVPKLRTAADVAAIEVLARISGSISDASESILRGEAEVLYRRARVEESQNREHAVELFELSAKGGHAAAQTYLGWMFANGRLVKADDSEAVKWYRMAAEQDHAIAQNNLGMMYECGRGVKKDVAEAINWYRRAAHSGNRESIENLKRLGVDTQ